MQGRVTLSCTVRKIMADREDGQMVTLGDVGDLSPNASVMLKVSILAAWAQLQLAAASQSYLNDVLKPYRWLLGPFWVGALRDYAGLRTDPEMGAAVSVGLETGVARDVLLPVSGITHSLVRADEQYYERSLPHLVSALAISLAMSDPYTYSAVDGQPVHSGTAVPAPPAVKAEPAANFYILYGLSFEALVKSLGDSSTTQMAQTALRAMSSLVRPDISGTTVFQGAFFDELCTVTYRIAMSEPAVVKKDMVELMTSFVTSRMNTNAFDNAQARRVLAVVTYVLRGTIPSPDVQSSFSYNDTASDRIAFLRTAFTAFAKIVDTLEATQRADLYAVGLHLLGDVLRDESPMDLAGGLLGSLKAMLEGLVRGQVPGVAEDQAEKVVAGLLGACITNTDDMR